MSNAQKVKVHTDVKGRIILDEERFVEVSPSIVFGMFELR